MPRVEALGVPGMAEIRAGDDLAAAILTALHQATGGEGARDGDIIVVSSKIVSKAEGRVRPARSREGAIEDQTVRVLAQRCTDRGVTRIVQSRSGPVLAAAGVDASNVPPGTVALLPADADASARRLRAALQAGTGCRIGVVVSDTLGRAWRDGQTDAAVGAAGIAVVDDLRGSVDPFGNRLEVTVRAVADEIAALADLVKGKLSGIPVAVVRGLAGMVLAEDGPGAGVLVRSAQQDWFRYGHVEAVQAALGVPPGAPGSTPTPVAGGSAADRLRRAIDLALRWPAWLGTPPQVAVWIEPTADPAAATATLTLPAPGTGPAAARSITDAFALGALGQRLAAAAWAADLLTQLQLTQLQRPGAAADEDGQAAGGLQLTVRARLPG